MTSFVFPAAMALMGVQLSGAPTSPAASNCLPRVRVRHRVRLVGMGEPDVHFVRGEPPAEELDEFLRLGVRPALDLEHLADRGFVVRSTLPYSVEKPHVAYTLGDPYGCVQEVYDPRPPKRLPANRGRPADPMRCWRRAPGGVVDHEPCPRQ